MADVARALISKIIKEGDLFSATTAGIRPDWFEDQEHAKAYKWMTEYSGRYGEVPTRQALRTQFPNYTLLKVPEPYEYYTDKIRDQHERTIIFDTLSAANEALDQDDPKRAQAALSSGLLRIGREVSVLTDENLVGALKSRYDYYNELREHAGELTGIPTGFETLDMATGGYHPEQFILFGGAPKQGKSWMLMKAAINAHDAGCKVLFISFEMSSIEQRVRHDAMRCGMNANHLMRGTLDDLEMMKLKKGFRVLKNLEPFIVSADISATTTVTGLAGKIDQHRPDIIFVDGVYLMESDSGAEPGSAQAMTSISRGLKRLAQRAKIPVVGTVQALTGKMGKDGAVTLHSLGWTSAWAQDADLILGTERVPKVPMIRLRVVGGRAVATCEISIACDWEDSTFEEVDLRDDHDDDD